MKENITENNIKLANSEAQDEIELFISQNREAFDEELPLGHRERFNRRLGQESHRTKTTGYITIFSAAAAAIVLGVLALTQLNIFGNSQSEEYEYQIYKAQMETVKEEIFKESAQMGGATETEAKGTVYSIMNESIPLEQLLPDELTKAQKDTILKKYYQKKLNGLNQYRSIVSQELGSNR